MRIEVNHALNNLNNVYENECKVELKSGCFICCPSYPGVCDYIRVVTPKGYELMYWFYTEWEEDGCSVIGAFMGLCDEYGNDVENIKTIEAEIENQLHEAIRL